MKRRPLITMLASLLGLPAARAEKIVAQKVLSPAIVFDHSKIGWVYHEGCYGFENTIVGFYVDERITPQPQYELTLDKRDIMTFTSARWLTALEMALRADIAAELARQVKQFADEAGVGFVYVPPIDWSKVGRASSLDDLRGDDNLTGDQIKFVEKQIARLGEPTKP